MSTANNLLQQLDPKKGQSPDQLAEKMGLSKARLFQVAKTLADAGALIRKGDRFSGVKYYLGDATKHVEKEPRVKVVKSPDESAEKTLSAHSALVLRYMAAEPGPEKEKLRKEIHAARGYGVSVGGQPPLALPSTTDIMVGRAKERGELRMTRTDDGEEVVAKPAKRKSYYKPKGKKKGK